MYLQETANLYEAKERLAIIFDASKATIPSFAHQKKQAEWLKAYKKQMVDYCVGTAYVIPNATIRAVLKMIFSLQKQPIPYEIFPKLTDAEAWVKEKLAEEVIANHFSLSLFLCRS